MYELSMLIKPASSLCELNCRYCFYHDQAKNRKVPSHGIMSDKTADAIIAKAYQDIAGAKENAAINFAFQGGEPTLAGIEFFKRFCDVSDKYDKGRNIARWSLQTNGISLSKDEGWAEFFRERKFLIGLSIDGRCEHHNQNRVYSDGSGSFKAAEAAADILACHNIDFNILTVVSKANFKQAKTIYSYYKNKGWRNLQFIPCLETLENIRAGRTKFLTPNAYTTFFKDLFDIWYDDVQAGNYISISPFDDYLNIFAGYQPLSCELQRVCSRQNIIEADGSVYPCDFYAGDDYFLGNINDSSFRELYESPAAVSFVERSKNIRRECIRCEIYAFCGGGCARRRDTAGNYPLCGAKKEFWQYAGQRFASLTRKLLQGKL